MPDQINAHQSYTKLRARLYQQYDAKGGDNADAVRLKNGQLYVKKGVDHGWWRQTARDQKYASAAHAIKTAINQEFAGLMVNQQPLGNLVFQRLNNPTKIAHTDLQMIHHELQKAVKQATENAPESQKAMAKHLDRLMDEATTGSRHAKNVQLSQWNKIVTGTLALKKAIVKDLLAGDPAVYGANDGAAAEAKAQQIIDDFSKDKDGLYKHVGLNPATWSKAATALKKMGIPFSKVEELGDTINMGAKIRQTGRQVVDYDTSIKRQVQNLTARLPRSDQNTMKRLTDDSNRLLSQYKAYAGLAGMGGSRNREMLFDGLKENARMAAALAKNLPTTPADLNISGPELVEIQGSPKLSEQLKADLRNLRVLQRRLQQHAAAMQDLALSLVPRDQRGIGTRPAMTPPKLLNAPSKLHNFSLQDSGLDRNAWMPKGIYTKSNQGQQLARQNLAFFTTEYNQAKAAVRGALEQFQNAPTDANLEALNNAVEEASIANDYLLDKLDDASRRHRPRFGHQHHEQLHHIQGNKHWVQRQRQVLQDLKLMITQVNDQRNEPSVLDNIHPADALANVQRQQANLDQLMKPLPPQPQVPKHLRTIPNLEDHPVIDDPDDNLNFPDLPLDSNRPLPPEVPEPRSSAELWAQMPTPQGNDSEVDFQGMEAPIPGVKQTADLVIDGNYGLEDDDDSIDDIPNVDIDSEEELLGQINTLDDKEDSLKTKTPAGVAPDEFIVHDENSDQSSMLGNDLKQTAGSGDDDIDDLYANPNDQADLSITLGGPNSSKLKTDST